jgi:hypothetical protein
MKPCAVHCRREGARVGENPAAYRLAAINDDDLLFSGLSGMADV